MLCELLGNEVLHDVSWDPFERPAETIEELLAPDCRPMGYLSFGITCVDKLETSQQFALFVQAAVALLRRNRTPPRTAYLDGAIVEVYEFIEDYLVDTLTPGERVGDPGGKLRRTAIEMFTAFDRDGLCRWPDVHSLARREWREAFELFVQRYVMIDDYCRHADSFLDIHPEVSHEWLEREGLPLDYYSAAPSDPDETELASLRTRIRELLL